VRRFIEDIQRSSNEYDLTDSEQSIVDAQEAELVKNTKLF
jgi:hypothetical protein